MPLDPAPSFVPWSEPGRTTAELNTGTWRTQRPLHVEATAPCRAACPAGAPIPLWIECLRAGDRAGAWSLIREENPLPAVTGRVCAHPCETGCNRRSWDEALAIHALERSVGDWGLAHGTVTPPSARRAQRVAVVGSGPAGLACAWHLGRLGYHVTLFERERTLGGLLRHGIPAYRLPRHVLDREIELVLSVGIEVERGRAFGRDAWRALRAWDATFVATGAPIALALGVAGSDAPGIGDGLDFLRAVNCGERPLLGDRVVVVGGGSTAMDVARTARRLGPTSVTVVALEPRDAMPASAEEVAQAVAEGVALRNGFGVKAFRASGGQVATVALATAELGRAPDGRIVPLFTGAHAEDVAADVVLLAIGQRPDLSTLPERIRVNGDVLAVDDRGATSLPGLFAGGDLTSSARSVAHAIGSGTRAARAIHARLSGDVTHPFTAPHAWVTPSPQHTVTPGDIGFHAFTSARRAEEHERPAAIRVESFAEVVAGLDETTVRAESARCFTCGRCTGCDTCFLVCPDIAIARVDGGYRISDAHCKGCGLCARECPHGALVMADGSRR